MKKPSDILLEMRVHLGDMGVPAPLVSGESPFSILVGTVVSLRTRDAVTREVTRNVLSRAATPGELLTLSREELESLLRPAGFFRVKARQLLETAGIICEKHQGQVPRSREALTGLPGVGGKTAAFVMGMAFGVPAVCVDVHVHRVSNRIGIVKTNCPETTETALMKLFPRDEWTGLNHVFVRFGQRVCLPGKPRCPSCPLKGVCAHAESTPQNN